MNPVNASGRSEWPKPAWNGLTNVWCQLTTGGQPIPPQFYEMFGHSDFLGIDVWPLDHPTTFNRLFPSGDFGKWGLGQSYLFNGEPGIGIPSGPAIPKDEPQDYPWDPSGGRGDPGFDVLILNDQLEWSAAEPPAETSASSLLHAPNRSQRGNIEKGVGLGKGIIVLHHALGDNNSWPWWYQQVTGGLLVLEDSGNLRKTQVSRVASLDLRPAAGDHAILTGVEPFTLKNEVVFNGMWQARGITPLLTTNTNGSDHTLAWIGPSTTSRVVCIQPGAAASSFSDPNFRRLVRNSILWAAGRLGEPCAACSR